MADPKDCHYTDNHYEHDLNKDYHYCQRDLNQDYHYCKRDLNKDCPGPFSGP